MPKQSPIHDAADDSEAGDDLVVDAGAELDETPEDAAPDADGPATADDLDDVDPEPENDDAAEDDADVAPAASAKGATKRGKKDAAKADRADGKGKGKKLSAAERRAAERARIERSKEIAAKARGQETSKPGKKGKNDPASMTKEQLRYSSSSKRGAKVRDDLNPVWFKPLMFGFLLLGLVWILVYYLSSGRAPTPLGDWNLLVGIGIAMVGFLMMTNWK